MITTQHSRFETNNVKYNKGFSLIEVLLAAFILSFISLALFQTLGTSLVSANVVNSILSEQDLKMAMFRTLGEEEQCKLNLAPTKVINNKIDSLSFYTTSGETKLIDKTVPNNVFKDSLEIVDIELSDTAEPTQKELKVLFKRKRVKHLRTRDNEPCDSTKTTGCYKRTCLLLYEKDASDNIVSCKYIDCYGAEEGINGNTSVDQLSCYSEGVSGESLIIGCGSTQTNTSNLGEGTLALGFDILKDSISTFPSEGSIFIGKEAGKDSNITNHHNTFIGPYSGNLATVTGSSNTFVGYNAGNSAEVYQGNTFLGVQSGQSAIINTDSNTFIGTNSGVQATIHRGSKNTFIGPHSGEKMNLAGGGRNSFIGYKAGYGINEGNDDHLSPEFATLERITNIGNMIITKTHSLKKIPDSIYKNEINDNDVLIHGNLKICEAGSCKTPITEISDLKSKITDLENRIQALETR